MKNKVSVLVLVALLVMTSLGMAAPATEPAEGKATVALLYLNNAKSTFDDEINTKMTANFDQLFKDKYNLISGERYIERLNKNGISDIATAERADILEAFKGDNVDYVVYVEIQPFVRKERITFFTYGKDMTAVVPMKLIDISGNKYLYNGKFTEFASDSSMIGGVGNKSVALKALDQVIQKMNPVINTRLPLDKAEKK